MIRRAMKVVLGAALTATFVLGMSALFSPVEAVFRICICPDVYAPVTCSNGRTYSNACVAGCNHATGCVPSGNI